MHTHLSYLMGGEEITDGELSILGITVKNKTDSGDRKLTIPEKSVVEYIALVKKKLTKGFWNEIVGPKKILFIFKFNDGHSEEYELFSDTEQKIDTLCAEFNNEPPEKTANVYKYISENDFYHDFMLKHYKGMVNR